MEKHPWELLGPGDIRGLRLDLRMSQPQFARAIGRASGNGFEPSVATIMRWEQGASSPSALHGPGLAKLHRMTYGKPHPDAHPAGTAGRATAD